MAHCKAITCKGNPCKNDALKGKSYCGAHGNKAGHKLPVSMRCRTQMARNHPSVLKAKRAKKRAASKKRHPVATKKAV